MSAVCKLMEPFWFNDLVSILFSSLHGYCDSKLRRFSEIRAGILFLEKVGVELFLSQLGLNKDESFWVYYLINIGYILT